MSTPVSTTAPKPVSVWEDFVDIFVSPAQVFARRENAGFFLPLVVVTLVLLALYFGTKSLFQPIMDAEFARQTAAAIRANPQAASQMEAGRKFADVFGFVGVLIGIPIIIMLTGLVLWFVGKFVDAVQTVSAALMVAAFAYFPHILEMIVGGLQAAVMNPAQLTSRHSVQLSVARLLNPDTTSALLVALAARVDVFIIWGTILLAIGLAVTGKISRARAGIAAAVVWVLGALPSVIGALWTMRMGG